MTKRNVILLFTFQEKRRIRNEKYDKITMKLGVETLRTPFICAALGKRNEKNEFLLDGAIRIDTILLQVSNVD